MRKPNPLLQGAVADYETETLELVTVQQNALTKHLKRPATSFATCKSRHGYPEISKWHTHQPMLKAFLRDFDFESIFEFGMGEGSTQLLAEHAKMLISIELDNDAWYKKTCAELEDYVFVNFFPYLILGAEAGVNYFKATDTHWDMVFCDGTKHSRKPAIEAAFDKTDLILTHDTELDNYRWSKIQLPEGWWWYDVKIYPVWSAVISNNDEYRELAESFYGNYRVE